MSTVPATVLVIIGAGPRGVGVLERLVAGAEESAGTVLDIHLIDPHPPGGGRIWRMAQSELLTLNSQAEDVTMFTDESCTIGGPIRPGPSLLQWAEGIRTGRIVDVVVPEGLRSQIDTLREGSFPTRQLQSLYLDWFYSRIIGALPESIAVTAHAGLAVDVTERDGRQLVTLADGSVVVADIVLLALGHIESGPEQEHLGLAEFAARHDLAYLPPAYTADADLSRLGAGQTVIVRGMGLAAVDLIVLLTEGRGGRFRRSDEGLLEYRPSGREPRLFLGSRRGVPYHSKIASRLIAPRPERRFFSADIARHLERGAIRLSLREDVWPLIAKEILWAYYHELFVGHPDRVSADWATFAERFVPLEWDGDDLRRLVDGLVPDPLDRLDLARLDRPLVGVSLATSGDLQRHLRDYIRTDLLLRSDPQHSATFALFSSLLSCLFDLGTIVDSPAWTARSLVEDLGRWWPNFFSYVASGPPAQRLEELLALSEAGIVRFVGAEMTVETDAIGRFVARSPLVRSDVVADALVEARLPPIDVGNTLDPVMASLLRRGIGSVERVADEDFAGTTGRLLVRSGDARLVAADGNAHPRLFAVGPYTSAPFVGAFSRPGTNAVSFQENDRVARAILAQAAEERNLVAVRAESRL